MCCGSTHTLQEPALANLDEVDCEASKLWAHELLGGVRERMHACKINKKKQKKLIMVNQLQRIWQANHFGRKKIPIFNLRDFIGFFPKHPFGNNSTTTRTVLLSCGSKYGDQERWIGLSKTKLGHGQMLTKKLWIGYILLAPVLICFRQQGSQGWLLDNPFRQHGKIQWHSEIRRSLSICKWNLLVVLFLAHVWFCWSSLIGVACEKRSRRY